jgi:glycosyltransferase involved in cell wall biosynthesis
MGPVFTPPTPSKYSALSQNYYGAIVTSCIDKKIKNLGDISGFQFKAITYNFGRSIPFVRVRLKLFHKTRLLLRALRYGIAAKLKKSDIDLIVVPDPIRTGIIGVLLSRLLGTKLLVEVNGVHTSPEVYRDIKNPIKKWFKQNFYPFIEGWVLQKADGIKILFQTQLDPFKRKLEGKIIRSFPEFVQTAPFLNTAIQSKKQILFVGHPFYLKGVDLLIEAFTRLAPDYPEWELKLLGHFPEQHIVDAHIKNHPRIKVCKPVFYNEIPAHIAECTVFVLPSRTEAMGRVLIEAAAAEKARIGANIEGIPTVINDNEDGLLFEPGNAADLEKKLRLLLSNEQLRNQLAKAAKIRAINDFSEDNYIKNLSDFFSEVTI